MSKQFSYNFVGLVLKGLKMRLTVFRTDTDIIGDNSEFRAGLEKSIVKKITYFKQKNTITGTPDPLVNK